MSALLNLNRLLVCSEFILRPRDSEEVSGVITRWL
jgi:hypothetical protein